MNLLYFNDINPRQEWLVLVLFCVVAGGLFALQYLLAPQPLPSNVLNHPVTVVGKIVGFPIDGAIQTRFLLSIHSINGTPYSGQLQTAWYQDRQPLLPGQQWRFLLRLKAIHSLSNPSGTDSKKQEHMRGILASAYVVQPDQATLLAQTPQSITLWRYRMQQSIAHSASPQHPNPKTEVLASIVNALSTGSRDLLSPDTWVVFQRTGTAHLMAISGLHVGLVAAIAYFVFQYFFRCFPFLLLRWPAQRIASVCSVMAAWGYGLLVGFSFPTQRAVFMITALMLSQLTARQITIWQRLALAFVAILAMQVFALFSVSFWLSFMAVFWIAYAVMGQGRHHASRLKQWWRLQYVLTLGLLPITLYCFYQVSTVSLIANAIAVPWVTLLIIPLCLLASIAFVFSNTLATLLWGWAQQCFLPLWYYLQWLAHYAASVWLHPINNFFLLLCVMIAVLLLTAPSGLPLKLLGLFLFLLLFSYSPARPKANTFWVTVLDVGQGLATVIQTEKHTLIYDTGPRYLGGFDAGRSILTPFLQMNAIKVIHAVMISHGDNDHIGGSFWLDKYYPITRIMSSVPHSRWRQHFIHCYKGQQWKWDSVQFSVMWPPQGQPYHDNNSSCVLRLSAGEQSVLLTGDIESATESELVEKQKALLNATVLIAPHHGSRSSSSPLFVQAVHPRIVIISTGYQNRYHLPSPLVLKRYRTSGAKILSTAKQGAIRLLLTGHGPVETVVQRTEYGGEQ